MAPRLKVFSWSDGFHSWTVATSSRPKALDAWAVEQDLFKSGLAHEITDGPEREAALAEPGTVIRTGVAIDPGPMKPQKPDPGQARRRKAKSQAAEIQTRIDALDATLSDKVGSLQAERDGLERKIADLEAEAGTARTALVKKLKTLRS